MAKGKIALIISLILLAFGGGIYLKDEAVKLYHRAEQGFNEQVQIFQNVDINSIISDVKQQIFVSTPLNVGGPEKNVVLLQSKIIEETNRQRKENGNFPVLKENRLLSEAAAAKANDMFVNQYFEHNSPSGRDPGTLVKSYGYEYIVAGENLILGNFASEAEVVQDWMDSPGHRANILNNRFAEIGVAIIKGTYKGETVWMGVQEFGLPISACTQPSASLKDEIGTYKIQLDVLSSQINELKTEIEKTDNKAPTYRQMVDDYNQLVNQYNLFADQVKQIVASYNSQVNNFNACVAGN